jgi:hypothetical protein
MTRVFLVLTALSLTACGNPDNPGQPSPLGSFIAISGTVHEQSPIADVPIAGVTVEVVEGEFTGRSTVTNAGGFFFFEGNPPRNATLRLTKSGYEERRYQVPVRSGHVLEDISLTALTPTAVLNVRIDSAGSTSALFQLSPIRFDASASRAVRPAFHIDFGDGESTTEAEAVHPCKRQGTLTSRLTVTDAFGRTATSSSEFRCVGFDPPRGYVERWWSPPSDDEWKLQAGAGRRSDAG